MRVQRGCIGHDYQYAFIDTVIRQALADRLALSKDVVDKHAGCIDEIIAIAEP
jgi:hypothetical protein